MISFTKWISKLHEGAKHGLPIVNSLGRSLATNFNLRQSGEENNSFTQNDNNCWYIAKHLADQYGYDIPSKSEVTDIRDDYQGRQLSVLYGGEVSTSPRLKLRSPAYLVVRQNPHQISSSMGLDIHVTFEYKGREFNYGVNSSHDWPIFFKIPLMRKVVGK